MEFAKVIQNEAVQEWKEKYIDYKGLSRKLREVRWSIQLRNNQLHETTHIPFPPKSPRSATRRYSLSSQVMSINSVAESANSLLSKVSHKLSNFSHWIKPPSIHEPPPRDPITSIETFLEQSSPEESKFIVALDNELEKVARFYTRKEGEIIYLFEKLKKYHESIKNSKEFKRPKTMSLGEWAPKFLRNSSYIEFPNEQLRNSKYKNAQKKIKKAAFELYRGAELLKNYRQLNKKGFNEILKKFDRVTGLNGSEIYMQRVSERSFVKSKGLNRLMREIETFYVRHFDESREQAVRKLKSHNRKNPHHNAALRAGLCLGLAFVFLYNVATLYISLNPNMNISLISNQNDPNESDEDLLHLRFYLGLFIPTIFSLLLGVAISWWTKVHINYKFIFELDPSDNLGVYEYLEGRIIASFWFGVEFRDFFIADVLNSLSYTFVAIQLSFCYPLDGLKTHCNDSSYFKAISTNIVAPFLSSIPAWLRIAQCLKRLWDTREMIHMINALKYASTILSMVLFWSLLRDSNNGFLKGCWIISQIISSTYTFIWDVKMDWSLLQIHSSNYLLRDELGYKKPYLYRAAIVINLFLRFSWVLILFSSGNRYYYIIGIIMAFLEILRRWMWSFIRVENEHVDNCKGYRAIKEIHSLFIYSDGIAESNNENYPVDTIGVDERLEAQRSRFDTIMRGWVNRSMSTRVSRKTKWRDFNPRYDRNEE
ncbi:28837_t:CDS:10, partial [Dentiscutata erythropus]